MRVVELPRSTFAEIVELLGLAERHAWAAALAIAAVLAGPAGAGAGSCWVSVGGIWLPLKAVFGGVSLAMMAASCAVLAKFDGEASHKNLQRHRARALLCCGGIHVGLMVLTGGPGVGIAPEGFFAAGFATMVHYSRDFVLNPLLIANLAYLAGLHRRDCLSFGGVTSTAGLALMASVSTELYGVFDSGLRFLVPAPAEVKAQACRRSRRPLKERTRRRRYSVRKILTV